MKYASLIVAALALATPATSFAQDARMSDARFMSASRCLAYAELPQLSGDTFDTSALRSAVASQSPHPMASDRARADARTARLAGRRAGDDEHAIETLRYRRDQACANFVSNGLVQAAPTNPSS